MNLIRTLADVNMDSVMNNGLTWAERFKAGGQMILTLMSFVFAVIFLIWLSQTIISAIVIMLSYLGSKKKNEKPTAPAPAPAPVQPKATDDEPQTDDAVTVAVITAAISAYLASESEDGSVAPFRVVSFKRANPGKPWNSNVQ